MTKPMPALFPVFSLLLAASLWGVIWYPLRLLEAAGLSGLWTTLASYGAALLLGLLPSVPRLGELRRQPLWLLVLALSAGWCNVAFILAVLEGTVVRVLLLFYLSPIWAVLLAWLLLGERLSAQARGVFALAVVGALIMLWDPVIGLPWPRGPGDWLAVSSGLTFALSNVMIRRMQQVSVPIKTMSSWAGVLLITGSMLMFKGTMQLPDVSASVWLSAAALGWFGIVIMTLAVQYGVTHMPVHRSAVILLFELIAGAVSAGLLTEEVVRPLEWFGGLLIIVAAYWAARLQTHE
ncbi:MAG: DMT family transporter [Gammaproteobacteria bacterium]|nr:DMT family transporter [Gammaproteobacteria bacterium]